MSGWQPTGRRRFRTERRWRGREALVLQIEERGLVTTFNCGHIETEWGNRWRDARTSDLTMHDEMEELLEKPSKFERNMIVQKENERAK